MTIAMRPELGVLPSRIDYLPRDQRGYPVPWFVAWIDGVPDFRVMDGDKFVRAVKERRCWVCGEQLGVHLTFVIGPMCAINRTISEPPSHHECAEWSARHCPFLSRPKMVRREAGLDEVRAAHDIRDPAGCGIDRNPGVACLWTTRTFRLFKAPKGNTGYLINLGDPERVEWVAEGRTATRAEVLASIESGFPLLLATLDNEAPSQRADALRELGARRDALQPWLPSEVA